MRKTIVQIHPTPFFAEWNYPLNSQKYSNVNIHENNSYSNNAQNYNHINKNIEHNSNNDYYNNNYYQNKNQSNYDDYKSSRIITLYFNYKEKQLYLDVGENTTIKEIIKLLVKKEIPRNITLYIRKENNLKNLKEKNTIKHYNLRDKDVIIVKENN